MMKVKKLAIANELLPQRIDTSFECPQSVRPQPFDPHLYMSSSVQLQLISSNHTNPVPSPKKACPIAYGYLQNCYFRHLFILK